MFIHLWCGCQTGPWRETTELETWRHRISNGATELTEASERTGLLELPPDRARFLRFSSLSSLTLYRSLGRSAVSWASFQGFREWGTPTSTVVLVLLPLPSTHSTRTA